MRMSVSEAKGKLTELVRYAEAGEDVILTRRGEPVATIVPVRRKIDRDAFLAEIRAMQREVAARGAKDGPSAARSQDFLYDEDGLPG